MIVSKYVGEDSVGSNDSKNAESGHNGSEPKMGLYISATTIGPLLGPPKSPKAQPILTTLSFFFSLNAKN